MIQRRYRHGNEGNNSERRRAIQGLESKNKCHASVHRQGAGRRRGGGGGVRYKPDKTQQGQRDGSMSDPVLTKSRPLC